MRVALFATVAFAASISLVQPLAAGPITYSMVGQISGTLGSSTLTNANFAFTLYGDTTNTFDVIAVYLNVATSSSFIIGGNGGTFAVPTEVIDGGVGVGITCPASACSAVIAFSGPGTATYALTAPASFSESSLVGANGSISTSLGALSVTGAQNLSFTATLSTPEPGTIGMLGAGFATLAFLRKRIS
jgi:hypothetical protein